MSPYDLIKDVVLFATDAFSLLTSNAYKVILIVLDRNRRAILSKTHERSACW